MKAYLVIVFLMPGHNISTQALPMATAEGCQLKLLKSNRLARHLPISIVVQGVIIQSFCLDNKVTGPVTLQVGRGRGHGKSPAGGTAAAFTSRSSRTCSTSCALRTARYPSRPQL